MLEFFENYAGLFIYPMLAIFLSLIFTYLCIRILPRLGYVDKPGGRHIHKNPVPRGGGIAVIFAFFIRWRSMASAGKVHRLSCRCSGACSGPPSYFADSV